MSSYLEVGLKELSLELRRCPPDRPEERFSFPIAACEEGKRHTIPYEILDAENRKLFFLEPLSEACLAQLKGTGGQEPDGDCKADADTDSPALEPFYLAVFSHHKKLFCIWGRLDQVYHSLVRLSIKVKKLQLNRRRLEFQLYVNVENFYHLRVGEGRLQVGRLTGEPVRLVERNNGISEEKLMTPEHLVRVWLPTSAIANHDAGEDSLVQMEGNSCLLTVMVEGVPVGYRITMPLEKVDRFGVQHSDREKFAPVVSTYCEPCALHVRRSVGNNCVLVKRFIEPIERRPFFRLMESRAVSGLLFQLGRVLNRVPGRRKVALFYEKFSEKAEEGTFELFQRCCEGKKTRCYFIIDPSSEDYARIRNTPHVVRKYSLHYYWVLFLASSFISTEAPIHLSMINSNNRYLRLKLVRQPFVFLQHGITYLKRQGERSTFLKGRAGEASYVVVCSDKEQDVVSGMLQLEKKRIWKTGMLIFDRCNYRHMNQDSEDRITIMLTWKPYEEHLTNFEDSTYFQYTMRTYELLQKYVDRSRINIVAHPRAKELLMSTSIHDLVWDRPISEVLAQSKLLITDYSSVCWNSFYQGGGVVFLQPDLREYEDYVGPLIPKDDEYIGHRVFDFESLDQILAEGLRDGAVDLAYFRTPENEAMYQTINEFHDGKNGERIYQALVDNGIL